MAAGRTLLPLHSSSVPRFLHSALFADDARLFHALILLILILLKFSIIREFFLIRVLIKSLQCLPHVFLV